MNERVGVLGQLRAPHDGWTRDQRQDPGSNERENDGVRESFVFLRFHRILLEEWAYIRPWRSETQRADAYDGFIHFYNHHPAHGALQWATPISIIQDNIPEEHT